MTKSVRRLIWMLNFLLALAIGFAPGGVTAIAADFIVYADGLNAAWESWSWDTTTDFAASSPVHSGTHCLAVTHTAAWAGLYLATDQPVDSGPYDTLQFWIHGGSQGGQNLRVALADGSHTLLGDQAVEVLVSAGAWTRVRILLTDLGNPAQIGGIVWQDSSGGAQPKFSLDDISLINQGIIPPPPPPPGVGPDLSVDASAGRRAISEAIYGMNYADESLAAELSLPVRRWGGNSTTRYNWQTNMHNVGSDWYFENIPDGAAGADGSASDLFVEQDQRTGTRTLMTVPLIGWTPKSSSARDHHYDCGFEVSTYGEQQQIDPWDPDCGNGLHTNGAAITGNAPADTSTQIGPGFVTDWIKHLIGKYGNAASGGVAYYNLDNEPMLWNSTHRDVHPLPTSYDEMRTRSYQYAAAIKAADPGAETLGPVLWGWCAYFYSALDGCGIGADYRNHGNTSFVAWYLQQMKAYEQTNGVRILDYLDLHCYPQANGVALAPAGNSSTQALRLRSTRSLWDASYRDESWISDTAGGGVAVQMIPRMKAWVDANYPGTKLAITEYNWGALNHINGALAQADVLGIFGREGLDLATLWGAPGVSEPGAFAFRIYRNYDGAGNGFGDVSTEASSADQDRLAVYAAQRSSDQALTVIVINKTPNSLTSAVTLSGLMPAATAAVYRYSSADAGAIEHAADQTLTADGFSATFPANSITHFVISPGAPPPPVAVTVSPSSATVLAGKKRQFTAQVSGTANTAVTWQVNGVTGGNATVGTIAASGLYTAPAAVPSPAAVTVTAISKADPTKSDTANVTVTAPAFSAVKLLSPNGGEIIPSGASLVITWGAPPGAVSFKLSYSLNNGDTWLAVVASKVSGNSYQWKAPTVTANKQACLVRVIGYDATGLQVGADQSDKPFTIEGVRLTAPNGGEVLVSGVGYRITWKTNTLKAPVARTALSYTEDGGNTWAPIITLTGNPGKCRWIPVVSAKQTQCKVRVVLKDADGHLLGSDASDAIFAINPPVP
jgi:hypothetical protein